MIKESLPMILECVYDRIIHFISPLKQIAPNRHIIPFIWNSQPPSLEDVPEISIKVSMYTNSRTSREFVATENLGETNVLEINIKVSMYTNSRTSREFVATENLEETSVEVLEECEAIDD
jgi:hypothetical protein